MQEEQVPHNQADDGEIQSNPGEKWPLFWFSQTLVSPPEYLHIVKRR